MDFVYRSLSCHDSVEFELEAIMKLPLSAIEPLAKIVLVCESHSRHCGCSSRVSGGVFRRIGPSKERGQENLEKVILMGRSLLSIGTGIRPERENGVVCLLNRFTRSIVLCEQEEGAPGFQFISLSVVSC